jgi:hypothetical protein
VPTMLSMSAKVAVMGRVVCFFASTIARSIQPAHERDDQTISTEANNQHRLLIAQIALLSMSRHVR